MIQEPTWLCVPPRPVRQKPFEIVRGQRSHLEDLEQLLGMVGDTGEGATGIGTFFSRRDIDRHLFHAGEVAMALFPPAVETGHAWIGTANEPPGS